MLGLDPRVNNANLPPPSGTISPTIYAASVLDYGNTISNYCFDLATGIIHNQRKSFGDFEFKKITLNPDSNNPEVSKKYIDALEFIKYSCLFFVNGYLTCCY